MGKDIYNVSLLDIMPQSLLRDPFVTAMARALDPELQMLSAEIIKCMLLPRIDDLPEDAINLLAWQFHVDFYDSALPLQIRREMVKNSLKWHRIRGTASVVEDLLRTVFENEVRLVEWFNYNAPQYYFKVVADSRPRLSEVANFFKSIDAYKNKRSWLDKVHVLDEGLFLIPKGKTIVFEHETGIVHPGQWVFAKTYGVVTKTGITPKIKAAAGAYTFPHIGVSVGLVARSAVTATPVSVTGFWGFPRLNIPCGVSPEINTIGQLKRASVAFSTGTTTGVYLFPRAGVSVGTIGSSAIGSNAYSYAGINNHIRCGAYNSGQEVA